MWKYETTNYATHQHSLNQFSANNIKFISTSSLECFDLNKESIDINKERIDQNLPEKCCS